MITGIPLIMDGRFGSKMSSFLNMVNSASVTYSGSEILLDGKPTDNSEIRFNYSISVNKFKSTLTNIYSATVIELQESLDNIYNKHDKLYLITLLVTELESYRSLLVKDPDGIMKHKVFRFSNISQDDKFQTTVIDESNFQEFYQWMDFYITKMSSFLQQLKDITEKTNQADFSFPVSMLPDPNASSKEKPMEYLDFLFLRNGINHLRGQFVPTDEELANYPMNYDPVNEIITDNYQDNETGEWTVSTRDFKSFFTKRIYKELIISRKLIADHVDSLPDEFSIRLYIKLTLSSLKYMLSAVDRNPVFKNFENSKQIINALINFVKERYEDFLMNDQDPIKYTKQLHPENISVLSEQTKPLVSGGGITTFKWNFNTYERPSTLLWQHLKVFKFIDESTDLVVFVNAFNGSYQEKPLKIRWTLKGKNQKVNKLQLFYLLNELSSKGLIEETKLNSALLKKIGFIFCDAEGGFLNNLENSYSDFLKQDNNKTTDKKNIDNIINILKDSQSKDKLAG